MSSGGSEIGRKSFLRALGAALQIRDVRSAPSELDTSSAKAVVTMDPGMMGMEQFQLFGASLSLAGVSSAVWVPVGPQTLSSVGFAATNVFAATSELDVVILGMRCRLVYNAAGALADNNGAIGLEFIRQVAGSPVSSVEESTFRRWVRVDGTTPRLIYDWSFPWYQNQRYEPADPFSQVEGGDIMSMGPIYVPAGSMFAVSMTKVSGGVATWPAATEWRCTAYGVACPKGMRPPFC